VLSTRLVLFRNSLPQLLATVPQRNDSVSPSADSWALHRREFEHALAAATDPQASQPWRYLRGRSDLSHSERDLLRQSGKSQDGLVARHVNRPISRFVTRLLLRLPLTPNTWSVLVFALPLCACACFLRGSYAGILIGAAIYQLYSILDGCDGEIARAKFLQSEFGRRLDSLLDLVGNILLALCLGLGLMRHWNEAQAGGWFYAAEGITAALCIALGEGIVFARRSRLVSGPASPRWNATLYQRHHEFFERSGILAIGDNLAWWLVQLTKRDMAMLAFFVFAAIRLPELSLHLLLLVSGITAAVAGNAFLRQPAPALPQEAS